MHTYVMFCKSGKMFLKIKKKILPMLLMTSYACNKAKHIRTTNKFRKVAIVERERGKVKAWGKAGSTYYSFFKKIFFKGL